jgi:hypothetical protein
LSLLTTIVSAEDQACAALGASDQALLNSREAERARLIATVDRLTGELVSARAGNSIDSLPPRLLERLVLCRPAAVCRPRRRSNTCRATKSSRESVFAACDAIVNEGRLPSVREICSRTGGTLTTVTQHRRDWAATLAAALPANQLGVPDEVAEAFRHLWQAALTQAQQQLDSEREALRVDAEGVHKMATAAQLETERVSARVIELEHERANAQGQVELLNDELHRRAKEHDIIVSSLDGLVEELKGRIATLGDDHTAELNRMTGRS